MGETTRSADVATVTVNFDLSIRGHQLHAQVPVPAGPTEPIVLLPVFQKLTDAIVELAVIDVAAQGKAITCRKGCGACCRQLVPISAMEARRIRDLIEDLPEPRRSVIRSRFAAARQALLAAGLLERLLHPEGVADDQLRPLGLEYFFKGIACPFLEDECCSIHSERPIACREYLVTSPAENCARPSAETVDCVKLAGKVSRALSRLSVDREHPATRWVPLVLAPKWADAHPSEPSQRSGPEILRELIQGLSGKPIPEQVGPSAIGADAAADPMPTSS